MFGVLKLGKLGASMKRAGFNPRTLFAASEPGAWYDPSDMSAMYQDAAGATPVYMPGQGQVDPPVGLLLDKRRPRGGELFSDGAVIFSAPSARVSPGVYRVYSAAGEYTLVNFRPTGAVIGGWYELTFTVASIGVAGAGMVLEGTSALSSAVVFNTVGKKTIIVQTTANYIGIKRASNAIDYQISGVSIRELPGNHAYQTTTTSRPTLSARYNLLGSSENLASGWSVFNGAFTQAGDYWKFTENTTANLHSFLQTPSQPKAALYRATFTGKPAGRSIVRFVLNAYSSNFCEVRFDLAAGTVVGVFTGGDGVVSSYSITPVGDGGYSCTIVGKPSAAAAGTAFDVSLGLVDGATASYAGDGVSGILVNKFDCRSANDGVGLPPYQRVVDPNTYDTVGFPLYLKFDGVDDFLQTAAVDFSGTDKLFATAALRKLSDSTVGIVCELSPDVNSNNGAFYLAFPRNSAVNEPMVGSKGTRASVAINGSTAYPAPISIVLTGIGDISGDRAVRRVNGVVSVVSVTDQGSGNYGNYPVYIGRRGGASIPFNGRLYSLLIRGGATPDATIAAGERYLNQKARIY